MTATRRHERGQGLAETALVLPLLVLLTLGLLQLGRLLWLRVQLQHAAQAAARAYTVWFPDGQDAALEKARMAAWLSLRPQPAIRRLDVQPMDWPMQAALNGNERWLSSGARLTQGIQLTLALEPWPGLGFIFPGGPVLHAQASILNEESTARVTLSKAAQSR